MGNPRLIGLLIERSRAFGRELCEGIITYAQERGDWELRFVTPSDATPRRLADFDGFIARVTTDALARRLEETGRPVVDVFYEKPHPRFAIVKENHEIIGRLAAEHFLDRHFSAFAYCPYGGGKTSQYCRAAFVQRLKRSGFGCSVYAGAPEVGYATDRDTVISDRIAPPRDAKKLARWLKSLPKPVAVFCPDDLRSWQLMETCLGCGIRVPGETAILGLDNDLLICGCTHPMLSSIDPNTRGIGRAAAATLDRMMAEGVPEKPPVVQIAPVGVVTRASSETYPLDPPWLSDALVFIRRNFRKGLSAADVFAHVGRSQPLVNRCFRETLGTTVQKLIAATRLDEAKHLLRTTDLSVTEIATRSGFSAVSYLLQTFTDAIGQSPGHWRRLQEAPVRGQSTSALPRSRTPA